MKSEFLATVAMIASEPAASRKLYVETLGLPLQGEGDGYHHSEQIAGCKSFGIWPLREGRTVLAVVDDGSCYLGRIRQARRTR